MPYIPDINSPVSVFLPDGIRFGKLVAVNSRTTQEQTVKTLEVLFKHCTQPALFSADLVIDAPMMTAQCWTDFDKAVQRREDFLWAHGVEGTTTSEDSSSSVLSDKQ